MLPFSMRRPPPPRPWRWPGVSRARRPRRSSSITIVIRSRLRCCGRVPRGWQIVGGDPMTALDPAKVFGALFQYPGCSGEVRDFRPATAALHAAGALAVMAADPLALTLLTPPGEIGADIAVGSTQRFGVPIGYGGHR